MAREGRDVLYKRTTDGTTGYKVATLERSQNLAPVVAALTEPGWVIDVNPVYGYPPYWNLDSWESETYPGIRHGMIP